MNASGRIGTPKVSVVIPCYNHARYLPDAVGSVTGQTYRDFEIIIVDDGSTDGTRGVAEGLMEKNPGQAITLIGQDNEGLSSARNTGISAARGEFILPLDADDMIEPDFIEETVRVLEENPDVSVAYTDWRIFGEATDEQKAQRIGQEYDFSALLGRNYIHACNLFRKKAWAEVGGYKREMSRGYEDWEFWITLGEAGHAGKFIDRRLFLYRKHGPSMIDNSVRVNADIFAEIRRLHPGLYTTERLDRVIDSLCREIACCQEVCREQQKFISDIHTVRGFIRRACTALFRRMGLVT